jgi:hypothetical protein
VRKTWLTVLVRTALAGGSYAVGAGLKLFPSAPLWVYAAIGLAVCILTFIEQFITVVRPTRNLYEVAPLTMDDFVQPLLDMFAKYNISARMNIMIPRRSWSPPWRKHFKIHWHTGMDNQPDVNISFPIELGVAGECFRTKEPVIVNARGLSSRALPLHIQPDISHLQFVASYPIYDPPSSKGLQSGKIIGVLNLDSSTRHAYNWVASSRVYGIFDAQMRDITVMAARFYR